MPLFYEKRVPEVLIQNEELSQEFYEILEDENLDEAQQEKLEKKFAQEIQVIKREYPPGDYRQGYCLSFPSPWISGRVLDLLKLMLDCRHIDMQKIREIAAYLAYANDTPREYGRDYKKLFGEDPPQA